MFGQKETLLKCVSVYVIFKSVEVTDVTGTEVFV